MKQSKTDGRVEKGGQTQNLFLQFPENPPAKKPEGEDSQPGYCTGKPVKVFSKFSRIKGKISKIRDTRKGT